MHEKGLARPEDNRYPLTRYSSVPQRTCTNLMASSLNLKIDALDEKGSTALEAKLATTLSEYLQPQSKVSLHDAAHSILAHLPADKPYSDEGFALASLVVGVAAQIPYQHPSHARLVRLLKYLTRSPKLVSRSTVKGEEKLCVNFQALGEQLRDNFQGKQATLCLVERVDLTDDAPQAPRRKKRR